MKCYLCDFHIFIVHIIPHRKIPEGTENQNLRVLTHAEQTN